MGSTIQSGGRIEQNLTLSDVIYSKLPLSLQNTVISLYGVYWHWLRFGGKYSEFETAYRQREHFRQEEWQKYQKQKLADLLVMASDHIPFYSQLWTDQQKLAAREGKLLELPLLEKKPLREKPKDFCQDYRHVSRYWTFYTSGSTGTPIETYWTANEIRDSLAVREVRSAEWAGVSFKLPRATFSGRLVEPDPESNGPFYRFNAAEKQVYFSPFHLRPDTAHFYVDALKKHKIQWMTGYAVSYYLLARHILDINLVVPPLKAVITTSEKLTVEMRSVMERAFRCRIYEEYSAVENTIFASECERGKLHVSPDVGIVEIIRPDGSPCLPGEVGEVVTTCLTRYFQPLIRYRIGDLAAWDPEPCLCGRNMPVIKEVIGRIEDVVTTLDGRQLVRFHGIFVHQPHIVEGQIIQEALDRIRVKVVPAKGFAESDKQEIITRVQQRIGFNINVIVDVVTSIERTKNGKFKAVISLLEKKSKID
jgi:phenylacetate-CoA ligase